MFRIVMKNKIKNLSTILLIYLLQGQIDVKRLKICAKYFPLEIKIKRRK